SAQQPLEILDQKAKELVQKHRLSKLEELFSSHYGCSAVSVLADVDAGSSVYSLGPQSSQRTNYVVPFKRTIPLDQQFAAPLNNKKDRQTRGIDKKPLDPNMPTASSSLHPIINESKPHNSAANSLLCINCGDLVFRPISSHSVQSNFYQILFEDEISYIKENDPIPAELQIPFKASCRNFDLHLSDRQDELTSNDNDKITPIEKSMPETFSTSNLIKYQKPIINLPSLLADSAENSRKRGRIDDIPNDKHDFQSTSRRSGKEK
ncbi:hypothetical protein GcM1_226055, partial [Golovinomyces cichoracearum]